MVAYRKYNIQDTDRFVADYYPEMVNELAVMRSYMSPIFCNNKGEIVVSYLKDHCLRNSWIKGNPELIKLITSGFLLVSHTESLFESCRRNKPFSDDFEDYIKWQLEKA
jgi:hypothetical protein